LDINQLCNPDTKSLRDLWWAAQESWLKMYGSSFPIAAALHGHTIAGGCMLALSCEYRVMVPNYKFGINEIQVGVEVPQIIIGTMGKLVSPRELELALLTGKLYTTEEAQKVGLVDELAVDKDDTLKKCVAFLDRFKSIPPNARSLTKQRLKKQELDMIRNNREQDIENFVKSVQNPEAQQVVKMYMQSLKNKN
jgi:3,2-trans-enoyl-CoA isomerase